MKGFAMEALVDFLIGLLLAVLIPAATLLVVGIPLAVVILAIACYSRVEMVVKRLTLYRAN